MIFRWFMQIAFLSAFAVHAGKTGNQEKKSSDETLDAKPNMTQIYELHGIKILEEYPSILTNDSKIKVLELLDKSRALAFGPFDFQTLTRDFDIEDDKNFLDYDYYIQGYLLALGFVKSFSESLYSCSDITKPALSHSALMFGLGGGSMPRFFHGQFPVLNITTVEIEPGVVAAAKKYFNVKEDSSLHLVTADIKDYLDDLHGEEQKFDFIFHDGCDGDGMIPALNTEEILTKLKSKLKPQGVMATNAVFLNDKIIPSGAVQIVKLLETYRKVFKYVTSLCLYGGHVLIYSSEDTPLNTSAAVANMQLLSPTINYTAFVASSDKVGQTKDWPRRCTALTPAPGLLFKEIKIEVYNQGNEPIDIYWDDDPKRFLIDCTKYPFAKHLKRSLHKQGKIPPKGGQILSTFEGHVLLAVAKKEVLSCITVLSETKWEIDGPTP